MDFFILFKDLIVFVQSEYLLVLAEVSHLVVRNVLGVVEQGAVVIVSNQRSDRIVRPVQNEEGGQRS